MEEYMLLALKEAKKSYKIDDVPVGAIIVKNNKVISKAHNQKEKKSNAIKHAELIAISKACKKLKTWRLDECELYTTLEPCMMCAGAILQSRINKIYYSIKNEKFGFLEELANKKQNKLEIKSGILKEKSLELLQNFFKNKRN